MILKFKHPFTAIIAGPSGAGKTEFVLKCLKYKDEMFDVRFEEVIWYYSEWQDWYSKHKDVIRFEEGLPARDMTFPTRGPRLLVLDDLMREANDVVADLFTKGCHHRNISVIYITQNIFHKGRGQRDISLNAHYIIYFKNPRDKAQIGYLARQLCPENVKFVQEAYTDATSQPYGYLVFDLKQDTPEEYRYRTSVFPDQLKTYVYLPKRGKQ